MPKPCSPSGEARLPARRVVATVVVFAAPAAIALMLMGSFLRQQCLWVDETSHLSGVSLNWYDVTAWLGGTDPDRFGVPSETMPPLSYWVGYAWSLFFGRTETSFRWLGVGFTCLSTLVVVWSGRRLAGLLGGLAAGLMFALSPNVLTLGVEIRSYPLFMLFAAASIACLVGALSSVDKQRVRWVWCLAACLIAANYTHFFGVVMAASAWTALLALQWRSGEPLRPLLAPLAAVLLSIVGITPFVAHSVAESHLVPSEAANLRDGLRMLPRLVAHPALILNRWAPICLLVGCSGILAVLAARYRRWPKEVAALVLMLTMGLTVTLASGGLPLYFNPWATRYNCWMWPAVSLLVAACMRVRSAPWKLQAAAAMSVVAILAANASMARELVTNGSFFAHGVHRQLSDLVRRVGPDRVAVVHDGDGEWGAAYFPLYYEFGDALRQFRTRGTAADLRFGALPGKTVEFTDSLPSIPGALTLLIVRSDACFADDLRSVILSGGAPLGVPSVHAADPAIADDWRVVGWEQWYATYSARVTILKRRTTAPETLPEVPTLSQQNVARLEQN